MSYERVYFGGRAPEALPWHPLPYMEEYLLNLEADGASMEYIRVVKVGLTHFGMFARTERIRHPEEIDRTHILRFQMYLNEAKRADGELLSVSYRQQIMKYVRAWINWMEEVEHIERNPWQRIRVGHTPKKPKPLEEEELAALFATHNADAFVLPPFFFHRRETILTILFGWGLRISELHHLNVEAMDMRLDFVTVRNKSRRDAGNRTKPEPYSLEMKAIVARWLGYRSKHARFDESALLVDQNGNRLSIQMIRKTITELGVKAGVEKMNPHRLRDTFGTEMINQGVPIEQIMRLMGHTKREQTLAYSKIKDPILAESHSQVMTPLLTKLLGGNR